ncbi:diacylglycerol kinase [Legionella sp. CNM-4043-24]|uniref:diacylglycerol kinase n=1 Tax=Legionella sp. CNM-4043-24 TaxID=3421646 RepID=UPI00403AC40F
MIRFFQKLYRAGTYSINGLRYAWQNEWAFRVELIVLLAAIPCAFALSHSVVDYILLLGSILLLMMMELLNSAVETTVNRISMERNELSGLAKDLGSAAVFIAILNALMIWIVMFIRMLI